MGSERQSLTLVQTLAGAHRIFLDTATVIYHVEQHPVYASLLTPLFEQVREGSVTVVCSPITLAECLILPLRQGDQQRYGEFVTAILHANNTALAPIDAAVALHAAQLRAQYNLTLIDAFQIAVSIAAGCDVFLTNDKDLRRVGNINILVLDDFVHSEE